MRMDIIQAINTRRSIRGYRPDPVPRETIRDILALATRAPSGKNAQPWEFAVLGSEVLRQIAAENAANMVRGVPEYADVRMTYPQGIYLERGVEIAKKLLQAMQIPREDREKRSLWWQRGFRYFDAPVAILILTDRSMDLAQAQYDTGLLSQTLCLAALAHGLSTCIVRQGVLYPDVIRAHTTIPDDKLITVAISLGYADPGFAANAVVSHRVPAEELTDWYGFPEESDEVAP